METTTLTPEETLYRRLLFAYLHYDGDSTKALKRSSELLNEVREHKTLSSEYKKQFENLFKDQASKLYETHENWAKGLKLQFDGLFEK
jgi:hypothetical protein